MNSFKLVQDQVTGLLNITENSQYNNIDADTVIVEKNVKARLYGKVNNVILKDDAILYLHGKITGTVENTNGTIHIFPR
jgi:hypothetical protein